MKPKDYEPKPEYSHPPCDCPACTVCLLRRAEAAARAPETAAEYCTRNGCDCPCCEAAHEKLRAISYDRAEHSSADIHCASTDRRDYHPDSAISYIREIVVACVVDCLAATYPRQRRDWFRETIDAAAKAVRPAATEFHETDTDAR